MVILAQLARHENLGRLELWPEVSRDDGWVHYGLCDINTERSNRVPSTGHSPNFETGHADLSALNPSYL